MDNHAEGQQKPIRLVKLSADYTPEGIRHRLVNNRYDRPPRIDYRHYRPKQYKLPTCGDRILQRTSVIYRIYLYYAFRLGVIHSYRRPDPAKLHWIFKDELAYLDRLSEEVRLMGRRRFPPMLSCWRTSTSWRIEYKHLPMKDLIYENTHAVKSAPMN